MPVPPMTATMRREIVQLLAGAPIFTAVDRNTIDALADLAVSRSWTAGAVLFNRGDDGSYLLALTEGRVRLSVSSAQGRELVLRHVGPGEVVGEFALIDGLPRSADATAVEASKGIIIQRAGFLRLAEARPSLGMALARHLCALLRSTNYQMESVVLYDLRMRVARFILLALRELHGEDIPPQTALRLGYSQTEFAAILGASRPKVNQVLQTLISDGVLQREGDILICLRDRLERLLDDHDLKSD